MSQTKDCTVCGRTYTFDKNNKRGATSNKCSSCMKKEARERTKRSMLDAAGGGCRNCKYSKALSAITFVDPIEQLIPDPKPKNREEKVEWASHRIALCTRCECEINEGMLNMKVIDAKATPPVVSFWTCNADIITPIEQDKKVVAASEDVIEMEILPPEK